MYKVVSLTHSSKYENVPLDKNPNPKDKSKSYIRPNRFVATDDNLQKERIIGWNNLSRKDKKKVRRLKLTDKTPNDTYHEARKKK